MRRWKLIRIVTSILLLFVLIYLIIHIFVCMNMSYPHPMLGIDANTWWDQYQVDLLFFFTVFGIPIVLDLILLIISICKINANKKSV